MLQRILLNWTCDRTQAGQIPSLLLCAKHDRPVLRCTCFPKPPRQRSRVPSPAHTKGNQCLWRVGKFQHHREHCYYTCLELNLRSSPLLSVIMQRNRGIFSNRTSTRDTNIHDFELHVVRLGECVNGGKYGWDTSSDITQKCAFTVSFDLNASN